MLARRHEIARLQSDFYRRCYRKSLWALLISIVIMFLLIVTIIYLILFQPARHYYISTTEGEIIPFSARPS
ncbi:MAG: hypothetical protein A3E83_04960 [Gammaproteobacteria bacterium RIFCSPHIGHO2_12_FULL_41_20]|nr:MAG: hypothetical protein A3E83_04960 [Gammaproteobacteria bacterium RIFCSPHIGHO2_12_FULL_41_20]